MKIVSESEKLNAQNGMMEHHTTLQSLRGVLLSSEENTPDDVLETHTT